MLTAGPVRFGERVGCPGALGRRGTTGRALVTEPIRAITWDPARRRDPQRSWRIWSCSMPGFPATGSRPSSTTPPRLRSARSSRAAASPSTARSATRPGERWTPPAGGSAPGRSTSRCPTPLIGDDVRAAAGAAAGDGVRHRPRGRHLRRPDRVRAVAMFQREVGPATGRRLRTAHHGARCAGSDAR